MINVIITDEIQRVGMLRTSLRTKRYWCFCPLPSTNAANVIRTLNSAGTPPKPLWRMHTWKLPELKSHMVFCGITVPLTYVLFSDSWKVTGVDCARIKLTNATRFCVPSAQNECSHIHGASHVPLLFCNKGFSSFTTNAESRVLIPGTKSTATR